MPRRTTRRPLPAGRSLLAISMTLLIATAWGCRSQERSSPEAAAPTAEVAATPAAPVCPDVASAADPVKYSFVILGCNRVDRHDTEGLPSTANVAQLDRIYEEIGALPRLPDMIFFTGDLVLGLKDKNDEAPNLSDPLEFELEHWLKIYDSSPLAGKPIQLVAMMGNHESLEFSSAANGEVPNPAAEATWLEVMNKHPDTSTLEDYSPCEPGDDPVCSANELNYSFRFQGDHFVVLNTDPLNPDDHSQYIATVPTTWLAKDIGAARQDPDVEHVFAFGHKPASTSDDYSLGEHEAMRNELWKALNGSPDKNGYYLVAHVHAYERELFTSTPDTNGDTYTGWEVIGGNAGSPLGWTQREISPDAFTPGFSPPAWKQHFGFTVVTVTKSEKVYVQHHGWVLGDDYLKTDPKEQPTQCWDSADVTVSG